MDRINFGEKWKDALKKYRFVILVILAGLLLMAIPEKKKNEDIPAETITPVLSTEEELEEILSHIYGAGEVKVLLTVAAGEETLYQSDEENNINGQSQTIRKNTVVITGADRAQQGLVRQVNPAEYLGAVIVCDGADRAEVRLAIVDAVSKATGLGADKISVLKMK